MKSTVWESAGSEIEVWIEDDGDAFGKRVVYGRRNSNMSYGIFLEEAIAIHHAIKYFSKEGLLDIREGL